MLAPAESTEELGLQVQGVVLLHVAGVNPAQAETETAATPARALPLPRPGTKPGRLPPRG